MGKPKIHTNYSNVHAKHLGEDSTPTTPIWVHRRPQTQHLRTKYVVQGRGANNEDITGQYNSRNIARGVFNTLRDPDGKKNKNTDSCAQTGNDTEYMTMKLSTYIVGAKQINLVV